MAPLGNFLINETYQYLLNPFHLTWLQAFQIREFFRSLTNYSYNNKKLTLLHGYCYSLSQMMTKALGSRITEASIT
jgi:hypothetical protein